MNWGVAVQKWSKLFETCSKTVIAREVRPARPGVARREELA